MDKQSVRGSKAVSKSRKGAGGGARNSRQPAEEAVWIPHAKAPRRGLPETHAITLGDVPESGQRKSGGLRAGGDEDDLPAVFCLASGRTSSEIPGFGLFERLAV